MATIIFDWEVAPNMYGLGVKRLEDQKYRWYEFSDRSDFDRLRVRRLFRRNLMVGFNSKGYDQWITFLALAGAPHDEVQELNDRIIVGKLQPWEVERETGVVAWNFDHIDLTEVAPGVKVSLKEYIGRMHLKRLQDLPFVAGEHLTHKQMDDTRDYCLYGDLVGTEHLYNRLREPLELREAMGKLYGGADFRSKSDAQMGEAIIKSEVEKVVKKRVQKVSVKAGTSFYFEPPKWMKFETPQLQEVFETICQTKLTIDKNGKVQPPKEFRELNTTFGASTYSIGIGGIHSTESNRCVKSDEDSILIDADVASQYPRIIMSRGLFPQALGKSFLPVYQRILDRRLAAKKAGDKITDKGLKISVNGAYGKLGSAYSVLYAPHLLTTVTITGQLSILMLIERAELSGISVVSGNTDGVVFKCPRSMFNGFVLKEDGKPSDRMMPSPVQDIVDWWETLTGFSLEFAEYEAIYNQSVNTYIAIKPGGKAKRKGALANHWNPASPDYDPVRESLSKTPQMTVCNDAVLAFLLHGTPIEQTIGECKDVREFLTVVKATGGATWREGYLGKTVRYYWSTDGEPIFKLKAHEKTGNRPKVPKTDGCRPLMTLPDDYALPEDLDFKRYIAEAKEILKNIGWGQSKNPLDLYLSSFTKSTICG